MTLMAKMQPQLIGKPDRVQEVAAATQSHHRSIESMMVVMSMIANPTQRFLSLMAKKRIGNHFGRPSSTMLR